MTPALEELRDRIRATIPRVYLSTIYGRDACAAEVESSSDPDATYQVLVVIDQGDVQASCSCPWWRNRVSFCKHILSVLIVWDREMS